MHLKRLQNLFSLSLLLGICSLLSSGLLTSCKKDTAPTTPAQQPHAASAQPYHNAAQAQWQVPVGWQVGAQRPMRVATYKLPQGDKASYPAECGIFFFGSGQGGSPEANIKRWLGQFATETDGQAPAIEQRILTNPAMKITRISIQGTYLHAASPMAAQKTPRPNAQLLGAIVQAPKGNIFFKCTGPRASISTASAAFDGMLQQLQKQE